MNIFGLSITISKTPKKESLVVLNLQEKLDRSKARESRLREETACVDRDVEELMKEVAHLKMSLDIANILKAGDLANQGLSFSLTQ